MDSEFSISFPLASEIDPDIGNIQYTFVDGCIGTRCARCPGMGEEGAVNFLVIPLIGRIYDVSGSIFGPFNATDLTPF